MSLPAIKPMVQTRFGEPFSDPDWLFEVKHDGFRALAYIIDGDCRLVSRCNLAYKSFAVLCKSIAADLRVGDINELAERKSDFAQRLNSISGLIWIAFCPL